MTSYLHARGFRLVDNRPKRGVRWAIDEPAKEPVMDGLRGQGIEFECAWTGPLATQYGPAWWTGIWG
ncbi:MAG: hypothetical protein WAL64_09375 [Candidatus Dormiibacterota bacterium]